MNSDLRLALLSLDVYNRGPTGVMDVSSIAGNSYQLAGTTYIGDSATAVIGSNGFYAAQYHLNGASSSSAIISFRGTDVPEDIWDDIALATGAVSQQSFDAVDYYTYVAASTGATRFGGDIVTTGHSLGGGARRHRCSYVRPRLKHFRQHAVPAGCIEFL